MADSLLVEKLQCDSAHGPFQGTLRLNKGPPSPFLEKKQPMSAFRKLGRAFGLAREQRWAVRAGSDGDFANEAPSECQQTLEYGASLPSHPEAAVRMLRPSNTSHQLGSLPSRMGSIETSGSERNSPTIMPTREAGSGQDQQQLQKQSQPAPPSRPRSLLSALLKRPSNSNLSVDKERSANPTLASPKPADQPGATSPLPKHSSLDTQPPAQPTPSRLAPLHETPAEPHQLDPRGSDEFNTSEQHLRNHRGLAAPDEHLHMCLSAPSRNSTMLSRAAAAPAAAAAAIAASSGAPSASSALPSGTAAGAIEIPRSPPASNRLFVGSLRAPCKEPPLFDRESAAMGSSSEAASSIPATSMLAMSYGGLPLANLVRQPSDQPPPLPLPLPSAQSQPFPPAPAPTLPSAQSVPSQASQPVAATAAAGAGGGNVSIGSSGGSSTLLATSACTPPAMQRSLWSLDDYSLHKRLYKGKMSSVYKGRCLRSGMPVALKVYFKSRVPANVIHMVLREVSIHLQACDQRNVLKLYGVFQTDELFVMVLEMAARGNLCGVCRAVNGGRLTESQVRRVVLEPLLDSLAYLHARGVCHRDIKPENILFTSDWEFRLADFGVSINLTEERAVTRAGTAEYMAPEVERCPLKSCPEDNKDNLSLAYTTAADVWSVGVLAYELLVGFPPLVGEAAPSGAPHGPAATLSFPASVTAGGRDFITSALAPYSEDRPTVLQLRNHPWLQQAAAQK